MELLNDGDSPSLTPLSCSKSRVVIRVSSLRHTSLYTRNSRLRHRRIGDPQRGLVPPHLLYEPPFSSSSLRVAVMEEPGFPVRKTVKAWPIALHTLTPTSPYA